MPLSDFFADMTMFGADGKRGFKSRTALVCLVLGAGIGAYLGYTLSGVAYGIGGAALGAFCGWLFGFMLRGLFVFALLFLVALAGGLGWQWLTGGFS